MTPLDESEGYTPLDPAEIEGLRLTHITTRGELNRWEQDNIIQALEWLDRTRPKDILNEAFVRQLHRKMFGQVWDWAGRFRKTDKNLGVPWSRISTDLHHLFQDAEIWVSTGQEHPDLQAVRLHHRLVSIHPFPNGNGRLSRMMADLFLTNIHHFPEFTWGNGNLLEVGQLRRQYIEALQAADQSNLEPLLKFVRS